MVERFFCYPGVLARMRVGPLRHEIDDLARLFEEQGYTRATARRYLSLIASFSRFAAVQGYVDPCDLDENLANSFVAAFSPSHSTRTTATTSIGHALRLIDERRPKNEARQAVSYTEDEGLLAAFERQLLDVRGLQQRSVDELLRAAGRMTAWYRRHTERPVSELNGPDVLAYVAAVAAECGNDSTRSRRLSYLRSFLRFMRWEGTLAVDLASIVPRSASWSKAIIPSYVEWSELRAVIDSIDVRDAFGKRDRALLLVLATTGIRNGELRRLELRDIRWRSGEIHLRETKSHRAHVVPLLDEAGRALADYALHGRPSVSHPQVFLCLRPPVRPMGNSSAVAAIVRRHLERAGLHRPRIGAHLIRHSLATRMVRQDRTLEEVADLLGHRHVETTTLYAKVALTQLAEVALPFPGGES